MAIPTDNAFSPDSNPTADPNQERKRRLSLYGLQGLAQYTPDDQDQAKLQEQPLYGGALSKDSQTQADAAGVNEPSQLDTSRVQRAPVSPEVASPLLGASERAGNLLTGEEGRYGPLDAPTRAASLKDFFGPGSAPTFGRNADAFAPQDPGTAFRDVQQAKSAYGYANTADQATGGHVRGSISDSLSNLFKSSAAGGTGAGGVGYGAGQSLISPADQAANVYYGASINPEALPALADTGAEAGTAAAAAPAAADTASTAGTTAASTAVSGAGGIIGAYSLLEGLYRALAAGGEGPTSNNQWADLGFSLIPVLGDVLKEATKGAWTPSQAWQDYGSKLASTLGNENRQLRNLAFAASNAKTRGDLTQAANMFRHEVGGEGPNPGQGYVGGYALGPNAENGAPQISGLPGATGKRHEWGIEANFDNPVGAMNQYLAAMYGQLPEGEATPLPEDAFNWSMTAPERQQYDALAAQEAPNLGRSFEYRPTTDISALRPALQDLLRSTWTEQNAQRYALQQAMLNGQSTSGGSGGAGGDAT